MALVGASRMAGKNEHGVDRFALAILEAIERGVGRISRPRRHRELAEAKDYYLLIINRAP